MADIGLAASELADAWSVLSLDERVEGFRLLTESDADGFFLTLAPGDQAALMLGLSLAERKHWLRLLMRDAVADVVHEAGRLALLELLDEPTRREVEALLTFRDDGAREATPAAAHLEAELEGRRHESDPPPAYPDFEFDTAEIDSEASERLDEFAAGQLDLETLDLESVDVLLGSADLAALRSNDAEVGPEATATSRTLRAPATMRAPAASHPKAPVEAAVGAVQIFRTVGAQLEATDGIEPGCWINVVAPTPAEVTALAAELAVEVDFLRAALDEEERPRIEVEDGATLIIVDMPALARDGGLDVYTTIPLGIVLARECIATVCLRTDTVLADFLAGRVKGFVTEYRSRCLLQMLHRIATRYLQYLRSIDKASQRIEQELQGSMRNKELLQLLKLEKSLVYFETSLKSNELVLEKLMRVEEVRGSPDDRELLEDVIIENRQAIEMANIYSNILAGTRDAFASVISNNLNIVMKVLTSVTIVMAIPTMVSSFFGMNVPLPLSDGSSFLVIIGVSAVGCVTAVTLLWRSRLL